NVFRKDLQGRFTFANQQYCQHYHCKLEDILGKTDFDFFPKELAEKYTRDDQRVMQLGQTFEITQQHLAEERIRRANAELARSREELRAKNELMEENLRMAREIQSAMLPQQYP